MSDGSADLVIQDLAAENAELRELLQAYRSMGLACVTMLARAIYERDRAIAGLYRHKGHR